MACAGCIGVGEICSRTRATGPGGKILTAGLARRRIEDGEFRFFADDWDVEVYEDEEGTHEEVISGCGLV